MHLGAAWKNDGRHSARTPQGAGPVVGGVAIPMAVRCERHAKSANRFADAVRTQAIWAGLFT